MPLARIADHALSWAQWFADSAVPGVLRAQVVRAAAHAAPHPPLAPRPPRRAAIGLAQRRRGDGLGGRVRRLGRLERRDAGSLRRWPRSSGRRGPAIAGDWTPLADLGAEARRRPGCTGRCSPAGDRALLTLVNRGDAAVRGDLTRRGADAARARAGRAGGRCGDAVRPGWAAPSGRTSTALPAPPARRRRAPLTRVGGPTRRSTPSVPAGEHVLTVRYRVRETGMYDGAPFVDEWKPLPPRLHDLRTLERVVVLDHPVAVATLEEDVTGLDLAEARAYAAARGPAAHRGRVAAGGRRSPGSAGGGRWSGTGPRASTATAGPGSACSRAARTGARARSGTSTAARSRRSSRQAAPRRRAGPLDVHRLPVRLGSAMT